MTINLHELCMPFHGGDIVRPISSMALPQIATSPLDKALKHDESDYKRHPVLWPLPKGQSLASHSDYAFQGARGQNFDETKNETSDSLKCCKGTRSTVSNAEGA